MLSPLVQRLDELRVGGRHLALLDEHRHVEFEELHARARLAARRLEEVLGPLRSKRVALLGSPSAAWVEAILGIFLGGAVAVPLSPLYPSSELAWFLGDAEAEALVVSSDLEARAPELGAKRVLRLDSLFEATSTGPVASVPGAEEIAVQLYTSGTTGKPKGAMLTHANVATQAALLREAWGYGRSDRLVHALPLHHLHGLGISLFTSLLAGASTRLLPRFEAARVWEELAQASVFMAVPTMYQKLFEAFDGADASTRARWSSSARGLRLATSGSAALPVTLAERWRQLTGTIPLERFGMTEIGVGLTNPLAPEGRLPGHVGWPLPTVELRIVDDEGAESQRGPGELWIRGPSVFPGYFRREEASASAFTEGWFRTGDRAERTPEGAVRLLGRTSVDILKSGGYKLSALEIEEVLREHPALAEVAVVGLPDAVWGDRVVAVVVAREGRADELRTEPLRAWARERLASYKIPREVHVVPSLPRNALGKVVKPDLVQALLEGAVGS